MAKRKKKTKKKGSATELLDLVTDEQKEPPKPEDEPTGLTECDYCGKVKQRSYAECDSEWELPGHEDHIFRQVCVDCAPIVDERYECGNAIINALSQKLEDADRSASEIGNATTIAWRSFHVQLNEKEMLAMAKKLKVKHPYLKRIK